MSVQERNHGTSQGDRPITVCFVGNPNCGKTTLFNAFTGSKLKVANWPGVTVERKEGETSYKGRKIHVIDTPGIYSLTSYTMEELVTRRCIEEDEVDVIVNVVDASSLERNLYLTLQLLELKKGADADNLINMLYKKTRLEDTFGVNMLAVADKKPETLSLKQVIEHHVDFQFEMTTRKYQNLLGKEQEKKEIQEGLIAACDVIDLIIEILRGSKNQQQVKDCLTMGVTEGIRFRKKTSQREASRLRFTPRQAAAILEMRLYKLIGLEIDALMKEHEQTLENIRRYEDILNHYDSMSNVIIKELQRIKKEYGRKRRTAVINAAAAVFEEKKVEEMEVGVLMDRFGYIKTVDKGVWERNQETIREEYPYSFCCSNMDKLCIFTEQGRMHTVKVLDLPYGKLRDKGMPVDNYGNYSIASERLLYLGPLGELKNQKLFFATKRGMVKLVDGLEFDVAKRTISATKLAPEDEVVFVQPADTMEYAVLQSREGYFLRFLKEEVPEKKKTAIGVRGMRLGEGDEIAQAYLIESRMDYAITYHEKKVVLNKLKLGKRDGKGTKIRVS